MNQKKGASEMSCFFFSLCINTHTLKKEKNKSRLKGLALKICALPWGTTCICKQEATQFCTITTMLFGWVYLLHWLTAICNSEQFHHFYSPSCPKAMLVTIVLWYTSVGRGEGLVGLKRKTALNVRDVKTGKKQKVCTQLPDTSLCPSVSG